MKTLFFRLSSAAILAAAPVTGQTGPPSVLTYHNDGSRTGANLQETVLNTSNVSAATFGKLFSRPVDDQIYSQLLYMPGVDVPGQGAHNVVFAATVNDTVYAFDADYPALDLPLWKVSFLSAGVLPPANTDLGRQGACGGTYTDFSGHMGIVGTPVIDPTPFPGAADGDQGTMYLVARTVETGKFIQRLHALDVRTGRERPGSPVVIQYSGSLSGHSVAFDPMIQNQRPGLALVNGRVYIGWASHCDFGLYHGWLMGYDAHTLQQASVYCTTPGGSKAGIWMGGSPPSFDDQGNVYLSTGNGTVGTPGHATDTVNRGESFLKLTPSGTTMTVASYFTPYNYTTLEGGDIDLGSAGLLLFPGSNGRNLAIGAGKQGRLYVVDRDNMGGVQAGSDSQIVQSIDVNLNNKVMGGPVYWQGPDGAKRFYVWAANSPLKAYTYNGVTFNTTPVNSVSIASNPGAMLSISANGNTSGTGVVWAMCPTDDANQHVVTGVLRALNAENVNQELWNSTLNSRADGIGNYAKFNQPTVANGAVYVPTFSNRLLVYGLISDSPGPLAPDQLTATAPSKVLVQLAWTMAAGGSQTGFIVERSTDGVTFTQIVNLPADARSYDDTTVARFTNYTYRIRAYNLAGSTVSPTAATSTASGAPEAAISVIGAGGLNIPADSVYPNLGNGAAFGQLLLDSGTGITHTFNIGNGGNAPLHLTGSPAVQIIGPGAADFTVTQAPAEPVAPQGSATFAITFAPHAVGVSNATVSIANDDPDIPAFRFDVAGLGAQQDLVAWWHFNENASSLSTADATGRGHTGTLTAGGNPVLGHAGILDTALYYDDDFGPTRQVFINVPDAPDLNPTDGITLCCWVNWEGARSGYAQPLVVKGGTENQYRLYIDEFGLEADFNHLTSLNARAPATTGWHHIAATYDGAFAKLYVDGAEVTSAAVSGPLSVTSDTLFIGGQQGSGNHFSGAMDDLRIYGRGLSQAEIKKLAVQKTAVSIVVDGSVVTKGLGGKGGFSFSSQILVPGLNVNFEIVPGPGQGVYRTDYGMSIIPPVATFPDSSPYLHVDVTPLTFNTVTGPLDVTLHLLEGDGYAVGQNDTATMRIDDTLFNQWRIARFGSVAAANQPAAAEDASPAGDGLSNIMKYAFDLPPLQPAPSPVKGVLADQGAGPQMALTYKLPAAWRGDLKYNLEWTTDLSGTWQSAYPISSQANADGSYTLTAFCPMILNQAPHAFMRLRLVHQ